LSQSNRPAAEVSRPFDGKRDGFVLGEGAAVSCFEELEHARSRRDDYAEVLGLGSSFDAYAATKPDPEARGAARAINEALREAKIDPQRRRLHQRARHQHAAQRSNGDDRRQARLRRQRKGVAAVVDQVDGGAPDWRRRRGRSGGAGDDPLHRRGPPTINQTQRDPVCDLDYVPNTAREMPVKIAVSTSFGFGGQNAAIVMRQFAG